MRRRNVVQEFSRTAVSLTAILCAALLASAAGAETNDADDTMAAGAAALKPYKKALMAALKDGLTGGTTNAIQVCSTEAPELAERHSTPTTRLGRSSHRLRNPRNAPPAWLEQTLARYLEDPSTREPVSLDLGGGARGYVEPIATQPLCLACHGPAPDPDLAAEISRLYPDDRATGFEVGDLRGVFWVEFVPPDRTQ